MFYNAHAYIAQKIFDSKDNYLIIGSILPDIAVLKVINWDRKGLHGREACQKFKDFVKKNFPECNSLLNGLVAHNILDGFSHHDFKNGKGYAYTNNQLLVQKIEDYYKTDGELTKIKAHNFIEIAVDILLLKRRPQTFSEILNAFKQVDLDKLSEIFAEYFVLEKPQTSKVLSEYFNLISAYDLTNINNWVLLWKKLSKLMELIELEDDKILDLLNTGVEIVSPTFDEFIEYSMNKGLKQKDSYV